MLDRVQLDIETSIPIGLIDEAEFNPKDDLYGVYKRGLEESIDYFGLRDRLKVWPSPQAKGRFVCLNGNKRLPILLYELLVEQIRSSFNLESDVSLETIEEIRTDSKNEKKIKSILKQSKTWKVPCQIMSMLDENHPFTKSDAELFVSMYDRNHARFNEVKQAELYRQIVLKKTQSVAEDARKRLEARIKAMVRPELPTVVPQVKQPEQEQFQFQAPGEFTPTESEPWGPNPPSSGAGAAQREQVQSQFIPLVFSISPEGYEKITESILKSKSRVFRPRS